MRSKRESGDGEQTQGWVSRKARLAFQFRRAAREEEGLTEWGTLKKKGEPRGPTPHIPARLMVEEEGRREKPGQEIIQDT